VDPQLTLDDRNLRYDESITRQGRCGGGRSRFEGVSSKRAPPCTFCVDDPAAGGWGAPMTGPLESIIALQEALDELKSAESQLAGIPEWMEELHAEHSVAKAEIDELEAVVEQARSERREAERVVADSQEKLKHFQEQVSKVRNQREYGALLQEIDQVKDLIRRSEEEGLAALERQEEAQQPLAERREAFGDLGGRYEEALEKWESEKPAVAQRAEELRGSIAALREGVQPAMLMRFDRIRERYDGQAMAEIKGLERGRMPKIWHCAACNYRVRPHVVMQVISEGSIVLCDGCKRILYVEPLEPEA
jgi:predicted  nucleic acid-binding Zn-ribbon protein